MKVSRKIKMFIIDFLKIPLASIMLFIFIFSIKRHLFPGIIFYEGIIILIITTSILIYYHVKTENNQYKIRENIYLSLISFFMILSFHTTVITIVDRSISIFVIDLINKESVSPNYVKDVFNEKFTKKSIDKRISEQEKNGNIYKIDNKLYLTEKGKIYHSIFYFIKIIFNTDDLIISKKK